MGELGRHSHRVVVSIAAPRDPPEDGHVLLEAPPGCGPGHVGDGGDSRPGLPLRLLVRAEKDGVGDVVQHAQALRPARAQRGDAVPRRGEAGVREPLRPLHGESPEVALRPALAELQGEEGRVLGVRVGDQRLQEGGHTVAHVCLPALEPSRLCPDRL